jgi:hypothetical protein
MEVAPIWRLTVTEQILVMDGRRNLLALESSRPESHRLASTQRSVWARRTICLTVHTLLRMKMLSCCLSTRKSEMPARIRQTSKLWATTERRLTIEMARPRISRRRISESRSRYLQTQVLTTPLYRAVLREMQRSVASRSRCCRILSC